MRRVAGLAIAVVAAVILVRPAMADDLKVEIVSAPVTVTPGDQIALVVQTEPQAVCGGTVKWTAEHKGPGNAAFNLPERKADGDGKVTWTWKAAQGPAAHALITITCEASGKSGKASTTIARQ
jgi:hypothetical protein